MKKYNVGMVGLGRVAKRYVAALKKIESLSLMCVYSHSEIKTKQFIDDVGLDDGVILYQNYSDMMSNPNLDIVIISTPDHLHFEYAIQAINNKKHVFIEKPVCTTLEQCEQLLKVESDSGVVVGVGYHLRWHTGLRKLFELVDASEFGSIHHVAIHWAHTFIDEAKWRVSPNEAKWWSLSTLGTHSLDVARRIMIQKNGEIVDSNCLVSNKVFGGNDEASMLSLKFESGATASIYSSILYHSEFNIEVYGERNSLHGSGLTSASERGHLTLNGKDVGYSAPDDMYVGELKNFIKAINGDEMIEVSLKEATRNIKYLQA